MGDRPPPPRSWQEALTQNKDQVVRDGPDRQTADHLRRVLTTAPEGAALSGTPAHHGTNLSGVSGASAASPGA